jgi:hypothetical protein
MKILHTLAAGSVGLIVGFAFGLSADQAYAQGLRNIPFDSMQSRQDFLTLVKESLFNAQKHNPTPIGPDCDEYGCDQGVRYKMDDGTLVMVDAQNPNGGAKNLDHHLVTLCMAGPNDFPYRICYNSDGFIHTEKLDQGEWRPAKMIRAEIPSWIAEARAGR